MGRLKRWWYLSKLLTITIAISTFSTVQAICYLLFAQWFEKLYTIIRKKEPRRQDITNFSFKIFKIMRSLRYSKCLKTAIELTSTTRKANACSPQTGCSVLNWKYLFLGKFSPETQNYQFKLKFCTQTNSNMQNSMVMFIFSVFDWKYLFEQIWSKKSRQLV